MAPPRLVVRQATLAELDTVMNLLKQRVEWLRSRGMDQWSTSGTWDDKIPQSVENGHVWLLLDEDDPIGTITVEHSADLDFWTEEEAIQPAVYLSKLAVRLDRAGAELGALLLDWASEYAYRRGCLYLRLDAWRTNEQLHAYYRSRGWTDLRVSNAPHRRSGALFQRYAFPMKPTTAARLHQLPPLRTLEVDYRSGSNPDQGGPDHGNWHPGHTHNGGVNIIEGWSGRSDPRPATYLESMQYHVVERDGAWVLMSQNFGHGIHVVAKVINAAWPLVSGTGYVISHEGEPPACRMVMVEVTTSSPKGGIPQSGATC